jgi:hypothetical protein
LTTSAMTTATTTTTPTTTATVAVPGSARDRCRSTPLVAQAREAEAVVWTVGTRGTHTRAAIAAGHASCRATPPRCVSDTPC